MPASSTSVRWSLARGRRPWIGLPLLLLVAVAGTSWLLTEPLEDPGAAVGSSADLPAADPPEPPPARSAEAGWPEGRLDGLSAKELLLDVLLAAESRIGAVDDYTATFRKRERINGRLGDEQVMHLKVRQRPFAIYLKFVEPEAGKEIVYAEGHYDDKVIAHAGGLGRLLIPRLAVAPDHPLALANNRHPITEAGLSRLVAKLVGFRRLDLQDPEAVTILDRTEGPDGRPLLRSVHTHPNRTPDRPFARVEVLYDPETWLPVQISNYDWPEPDRPDELPLAEEYAYRDLDLDADLGHLDFDPANPEYAFQRF